MRQFNRLARLWIGLALSLVLVACSSSGNVPEPSAAGGATTQLDTPNYTLAAGDQIKVTVFRHDDLSGEYELDGSGNFAMPLIGEVRGYGLSARELESAIEGTLAEGYLVDPQVSIEVLTYRPFYILGEINTPGQYEYVSGMTVLNAVALAGGFTYRAKTDGVTVQRGGANTPPVGVNPDTQILPGDIISVPERFF